MGLPRHQREMSQVTRTFQEAYRTKCPALLEGFTDKRRFYWASEKNARSNGTITSSSPQTWTCWWQGHASAPFEGSSFHTVLNSPSSDPEAADSSVLSLIQHPLSPKAQFLCLLDFFHSSHLVHLHESLESFLHSISSSSSRYGVVCRTITTAVRMAPCSLNYSTRGSKALFWNLLDNVTTSFHNRQKHPTVQVSTC